MSQQINLFNPIFLKQKKYFSAVTMVQALGLIAVGSALLSVYTIYRVSMLGKEADATSAQLAALRTKADKINVQYTPRQKSKSLESEIRNAESELKPLQYALKVLQKGDFGNADGYAKYMRAFSRQIVDGVWLTGFTIDGAESNISLQGRALKPELVPVYITRLKNEPVLQGKSFAALDMQGLPVVPAAKAELLAKGKQLAVTQKAAVAYIDFNLQSSSMIKERQTDKGVKAEPAATAIAYLEAMRALGTSKEAAGPPGAKSK
jgi:hypothetical protein